MEKKETGKNSAKATFHCTFPFTLNRPITNRRKTKINTIVKTATRVKSCNQGKKTKQNKTNNNNNNNNLTLYSTTKQKVDALARFTKVIKFTK